MATQLIGGESAHVTPTPPAQGLHTPAIGFAPMPAVAAILSRYSGTQLAAFIEVAVGLLDLSDPDCDLEDATDLEDDHALSPGSTGDFSGPGCEVADTGENAWVEWDKMRGSQKSGSNLTAGNEDDEDDDPDRSLDEGEPDFARYRGAGAGCEISDPGGCQHDGREPDSDVEREQMIHDVPVLPVMTLNHNLFNDQRQPLGMSNLQ